MCSHVGYNIEYYRKKRKANPVFVQPSNFAKFGENAEVSNLEVSALDITATPKSQENI